MRTLLLITLLSISSFAYAHSEHTTINYNNIYNSDGVALAIASARHSFDMGTFHLQGSVAAGFYNGAQAVSIAVGKRYKDMLINASIGIEGNKLGGGVGLTWRF